MADITTKNLLELPVLPAYSPNLLIYSVLPTSGSTGTDYAVTAGMLLNQAAAGSEIGQIILQEAEAYTDASLVTAKAYTDASLVTAKAYTDTSVSGLSNFTQSGAGAVTRTISNKLKDYLDIMDFGPAANGTTDDSTVWQTAINAAQAQNKGLRVPGYSFMIGATLTGFAGLVIEAEPNATLIGAASLTGLTLTIPNLTSGSLTTRRTQIRGLTFSSLGAGGGLQLSNNTFVDSSKAPGPVIEDCVFTSINYTGAGGYLLTLINLEEAVLHNLSFQTYSANGMNGVNAALHIQGCANLKISDVHWQYCSVAITMGSGSIVSQGIYFSNCQSNGCVTTLSSNLTEDCSFTNCLFDNHQSSAITSVDDLGLSFTNCYFGSSATAAPICSVGITTANKPFAKFIGCIFIPYATNSTTHLQVFGVSGTVYNNLQVVGCQFRNAQLVAHVCTAQFVVNCLIDSCILVGTPTGVPVIETNKTANIQGLRVSNSPGISATTSLGGSGAQYYPAFTVLGSGGITSGVSYTNPYPFDCMVYISGGSFSNVVVGDGGFALNLGAVSAVRVSQGGRISVTYSSLPTWTWVGVQ